MEILGAILLVDVSIGILFALGAKRLHRKPESQQRDGILAGESMFVIAPAGSMEPIPIRQFRRTCGCKTPGCTLDYCQLEPARVNANLG
jgi:hypothetical protein